MAAVITGSQNGTVGLINTGTAVASTSGTSIDFTGIPAGVKRITVMFNGVSTNGTSTVLIQCGTSGGFVASGYVSNGSAIQGTSVGATSYTTGFGTSNAPAAANVYSGIATVANQTSNTWVMSSCFSAANAAQSRNEFGAGVVSLSGTLDRIRITTVNGTDTFDAGSINILYE